MAVSPVLGLQARAIASDYLSVFWGSELSFPCLCGNTLLPELSSPLLLFYFNAVYLPYSVLGFTGSGALTASIPSYSSLLSCPLPSPHTTFCYSASLLLTSLYTCVHTHKIVVLCIYKEGFLLIYNG